MNRIKAETDPRVLVYVAALRELTHQRESGGITTEEYWSAIDVLDERFADVRDWQDRSDADK